MEKKQNLEKNKMDFIGPLRWHYSWCHVIVPTSHYSNHSVVRQMHIGPTSHWSNTLTILTPKFHQMHVWPIFVPARQRI